MAKNRILCSVTDAFKVHPQSMYHVLTVKQLSNGKQINWGN